MPVGMFPYSCEISAVVVTLHSQLSHITIWNVTGRALMGRCEIKGVWISALQYSHAPRPPLGKILVTWLKQFGWDRGGLSKSRNEDEMAR